LVETLLTLLFGTLAVAIKVAIVQRLPPGTPPVMPSATFAKTSPQEPEGDPVE
jgi:hypothetical protein